MKKVLLTVFILTLLAPAVAMASAAMEEPRPASSLDENPPVHVVTTGFSLPFMAVQNGYQHFIDHNNSVALSADDILYQVDNDGEPSVPYNACRRTANRTV